MVATVSFNGNCYQVDGFNKELLRIQGFSDEEIEAKKLALKYRETMQNRAPKEQDHHHTSKKEK